MSYQNGLGNLQQLLTDTGLGGIGKTSAPVKTEQASLSLTGAVKSPRAAEVLSGDEARLSGAGASIALALSGSDVRFDKVAELQKSIAAGTYNVSSSDVAGKLIQSLLK